MYEWFIIYIYIYIFIYVYITFEVAFDIVRICPAGTVYIVMYVHKYVIYMYVYIYIYVYISKFALIQQDSESNFETYVQHLLVFIK